MTGYEQTDGEKLRGELNDSARGLRLRFAHVKLTEGFRGGVRVLRYEERGEEIKEGRGERGKTGAVARTRRLDLCNLARETRRASWWGL